MGRRCPDVTGSNFLLSVYEQLLAALTQTIGRRKVLWFGTRGIDALPYLALPQFEESFSITDPLGVPGIAGSSLEQLTTLRVDLDTYDIDRDPAPQLSALRRDLLATMSAPTIVVAYRPSRFLSSIQFPRLSTVVPAFLFQEEQAVFEHKPWVETQLQQRGIQTIPWEYIADEQHAEVLRRLGKGPLILRSSKGSGGVGLVRVDDAEGIVTNWPRQVDAFASVAPFLDGVVPINVAGCVGAFGEVALHPLSVQLIGVATCTRRTFGYCGNDYGAAQFLDSSSIEGIEHTAHAVGRWLATRGYVGAFGVDLLVSDGVALFTEVNARFQGCSLLGSEVDRRLGLPDVHLEHLASHLGVPIPPRPSLVSQVRSVEPVAHVVVHNASDAVVTRRAPASPISWPANLTDVTSVPEQMIAVAPGAVLFRFVLDTTVTQDGFVLSDPVVNAVHETLRSFVTAPLAPAAAGQAGAMS